MTPIYGSTGVILGYLHRVYEFSSERKDLCSSCEPLQVAAKHAGAGRAYPAHRHLPHQRTTSGIAEAWIVIAGAMRVHVSEGEKPYTMLDLGAGDCYVSVAGVHGIEILADGTLLYEIKNGPYLGRAADKELV